MQESIGSPQMAMLFDDSVVLKGDSYELAMGKVENYIKFLIKFKKGE